MNMGKTVKYLSVCSGIEAATVAWHDLGYEPVGFSEIEKFPSAVLAHHYPDVPNFGDMTKFKEWKINEPIGLLVGGTPCQSFSVAGLRKGLEDPRGNLALTYVGILEKFRPKWFVWENVPGVLSSNGGRDFGSFLGAVAELGYGFAYRVLDAQYFGVAQRRRRVFVVGCFGDWESAAKVLFEPESLRRNTSKSKKKREGITGYVESSFGQYRPDTVAGTTKASGGVLGGGSETFMIDCYENHGTDSRIKPVDISPTVTARWGTGGNNTPLAHSYCLQGAGTTSQNSNGSGFKEEQSFTLNVTDVHGVAYGFEPGIAKREGNPARFIENKTPTIRANMGDNQTAVAHTVTARWGTGGNNVPLAMQGNLIGRDAGGPNGVGVSDSNTMYTLTKTDVHAVAVDMYNLTTNQETTQTLRGFGHIDHVGGIMKNMAVRRLTEIECERLQGFPDNYTNIRENCPSGARYKALGNSMAVPVMRWIGQRINEQSRH